MTAHAYQLYRQTQVSTASPGELLLMLFDGAIRFARQAQEHLRQGDLEAANSKLIRVQDIVSELNLSLDLSVGEIAVNLQQLYTYIYDRLVQANIRKDPEIVEEALVLLMELRDTWEQVVAQTR
ncbi:MAG: flagellar export chaperone FliS [Limnochordia bacterium]|nr:flagellar export chaperone FliS [Limnochordia bacterium]HOB40327.1 flagellar export chaperone FliS [Limnochordia bacterium]HPP72684.1 flagellar export chaperone FliS [Limnochordia bacterium]HPU64267.1 flagellar export chaperone FliS [Limnochordia bacterium]HPZ79745.1 flagellar export chaperone FliS [Limnochordia bacterium]